MIPFPEPLPAPAPVPKPRPARRQRCTDCRHWLTAPVPPERWVEGGCVGPKCAKDRGIKPAGSPRIVIRWRGSVKDQIDLLKINEGEEMTTTTSEREEKPCWILVYPDGDRVHLDYEVHFASEEDAAKDITQFTNADQGEPKPERLTEACVTISCSFCETTFDEEGEGIIEHHPSVESALSVAKQCGWTVTEDGKPKCEPCSHDCDCHGCKPDCEGEGR